MDTNQKIKFEIDFRKWLVFSESAKNPQLLKNLKKAINNKKSYDGILVEKDKTNSGYEYYFIESGNPIGLKIGADQYIKFLNYFQNHYDKEKLDDNTFEKGKQESQKFIGYSDPEIKTDQNSQLKYNDYNSKKTLNFLRKISSINKLKHSFNFSLLGLLVLQVVIIPENIGGHSLGNINIYAVFGIMLLTWFLNFWAYSKFFFMKNTYREIFRLTASYFSILWLIAFLEIIIIESLQGKFSLLASLIILFIGQISGLIISLFTTMIVYFIRGGKMINVK